MPEQLASEISNDDTSTSDLKASFPDTEAFTDLMSIPSLVFLGQTIESTVLFGHLWSYEWGRHHERTAFNVNRNLRVIPNAHEGQ